jgi:hypothetical protein|tara:strand:+ start:509 stop:820 length:312 start_codon:yes stop_codon:yes gene_type:complete
MALYYNITGSTGVTTELLAPNNETLISSVLLTNVHDTADATVTLFIQDDPASGATSTYNIIHTIAIPADSSLVLDDPVMFKIQDSYGLYITVGSSDTVDVILS